MNKECSEILLSCLNLVYQFILMEDSELALKVLSEIIDLTRYFSESKENMVMLSQEIQQIETFLSILELRFQKNFEYEIYLKEDLNTQFIKRFCFIEPIMKFFINYIEVESNKKIMKIYIQNEMNSLNMRIENRNANLYEEYIYYL